ncbi:MAG TPA: HAMP domain-containing histidine kinase [Clostridia bacterium]|nr:HAMP domain-containing histidine kinase [Clostridia bacterium]
MKKRDILNKRQSLRVLGNLQNSSDPQEIALLGHGIKSPLARIVALSELLLKELPGELNEEQKEYVQDIYNNSFLLLNSVNSLLSITRTESGYRTLNIGPFDMKEIVESVVVRVDSVAVSRGSEIIIDIPEDLPIVYCDRYKIEQVLYNLLDNAMKFTLGGSITVSAQEMPDKMIRVSVSDTGTGIKEKHKNKVFEKYFTEKNALNPDGSGLGLTVVKEIVNLHQGEVWLESRVGQGTTVHFVIPNEPRDKEKELASHAGSFK